MNAQCIERLRTSSKRSQVRRLAWDTEKCVLVIISGSWDKFDSRRPNNRPNIGPRAIIQCPFNPQILLTKTQPVTIYNNCSLTE